MPQRSSQKPRKQTVSRRQRGEGSIYQRPDGRWVGVLHLGWREGKRRRKVIYGKTQAEVVRKLGQAKRERAMHGDVLTSTMTLQRWLDHWLANIAPRTLKPGTLDGYREKARNYIGPTIGRHRLDRLTTDHVRELHHYVMVTQGLSSTTAMHTHRCLSAALTAAIQESPPLVQRNVAKLVKAPKKREPTRRGMSVPEALAVLDGAGRDKKLGARWMVALMLGIRQGERLGMCWSRLDLDAGVADLSWQLQPIPYRHGCDDACDRRRDHCPKRELDVQPDFVCERLVGNLCLIRPKTAGSIRVIPLPPPVVEALRERHEVYLAQRENYLRDYDLVWCRDDGRPLLRRRDWQDWSTLLTECGIPHLTQHETRHTTATLLQSCGVPEDVRMAIMGHSEAATQRGYAHVDLGLQRKALETLGERLQLG